MIFMVLDILVDKVMGTRQEFGARYELALFRLYEAFHNPQRDPVPDENPVKSAARDAVIYTLALYEASLMRPGSASYGTRVPDNVREFRSR